MSTQESTATQLKSTQSNNEVTLPLLNVQVLKESLAKIKMAMDLGCKNGAYSLDDAYNVKLSFDNLGRCVEVLSQYQRIIPDLIKQKNEKNETAK